MVLVRTHADKDDEHDQTVTDFRGNPADKSKTGGWRAAGLILGTELAERICVIGVQMNLVTYLVGDLHISTPKSANIVTNVMGTLNLVGLLVGFLADAKLGRYLTVAVSATIISLGVSLLALATTISSLKPPPCSDSRRQHHQCIEASSRQLAMVFVSLYTIALGAGGIKSNVSGFGSDQFDNKDPKEEKAMVFFFNRFYFCVSCGSLFAATVMVYIQDNVGRGWGYGISAGLMAISVIILLAGTPIYRLKKPQGSPITIIWKVLSMAWKKRSLPYPSHPSLLNEFQNAKVPHTQRLRWLDKAAVVHDSNSDEKGTNHPWMTTTVTQVEEVKLIVKLIPIWSSGILFWTVYSQMSTFSVEQATTMNRKIGSFVIRPGSMSIFLFISILLFTSLNERFVVPLARKFTQNAQGITSLQRISIGLIFSIVAMIVAANVEKQRRRISIEHDTHVRVFWLVPQYFLVGAGEAFVYVGQLEFFIREAPDRMKSMSTGLFVSTLAMGYYVSSLLVTLVDKATKNGWIGNDLNKGKLDNFYWLLAALGVFNFSAFLLFASRHQYKMQQCNSLDNGEEPKGWNDDSVEKGVEKN